MASEIVVLIGGDNHNNENSMWAFLSKSGVLLYSGTWDQAGNASISADYSGTLRSFQRSNHSSLITNCAGVAIYGGSTWNQRGNVFISPTALNGENNNNHNNYNRVDLIALMSPNRLLWLCLFFERRNLEPNGQRKLGGPLNMYKSPSNSRPVDFGLREEVELSLELRTEELISYYYSTHLIGNRFRFTPNWIHMSWRVFLSRSRW